MQLLKRQEEYQRFATKVLLATGFNPAEAPEFSGKAGQLDWCVDRVAKQLIGVVIRVIKGLQRAKMIREVRDTTWGPAVKIPTQRRGERRPS